MVRIQLSIASIADSADGSPAATAGSGRSAGRCSAVWEEIVASDVRGAKGDVRPSEATGRPVYRFGGIGAGAGTGAIGAAGGFTGTNCQPTRHCCTVG